MNVNPDDLVETLADDLWQMWRMWSERSYTGERITAEQYWILRMLERERSMTVSGLAKRRGVTPAAKTAATRRLEAMGWVSRVRPPENLRKVLVTLSDAGREVWLRVSTERRRVLAHLLRAMTPDEQDTLYRIARKMRTPLMPVDGLPAPSGEDHDDGQSNE